MAPERLPEPSDPPVLTLEHPMGAAGYTDEGGGHPILCVHGLPGSHRDFRYLAACLKDFRVIRLDMPGFGASSTCAPASDFKARTDFVLNFIEALELEKPLLLGHSMGGAIVAMAATRAPTYMSAIGLLASPGMRRHRGAPDGRAKLVAWLSHFPLTAPMMRAPVERAFRKAGFPSSLSHQARVTALRQVGMYNPDEVARAIKGVRLPTLVGYADDDPLVETDISDEIAERCPPGPRLCFKDAGHNIQKTRANEIAEAIRKWSPWV